MTNEIRSYRRVMFLFTRDERIEWRDEKRKKGSVPVEYYDAVDAVSLPDHLGNKVNIIIEGNYGFDKKESF